jgi:hypothetical protein
LSNVVPLDASTAPTLSNASNVYNVAAIKNIFNTLSNLTLTTTNVSTNATTTVAVGNPLNQLTLQGSIIFNKTQTVNPTGTHTASYTGFPLVAIIACSDESTTDITTTNAAYFRVPFKCKIIGVRASLNTGSTTAVTIDVQKSTNAGFTSGGISLITSPLLTILPNATTSVVGVGGSGGAINISNSTNIVDDDNVIGAFVRSVGTGAKGLKVSVYYTYYTT